MGESARSRCGGYRGLALYLADLDRDASPERQSGRRGSGDRASLSLFQTCRSTNPRLEADLPLNRERKASAVCTHRRLSARAGSFTRPGPALPRFPAPSRPCGPRGGVVWKRKGMAL